jgi:hypothetical protein
MKNTTYNFFLSNLVEKTIVVPNTLVFYPAPRTCYSLERNFMPVYLRAPVVSFRPPLGISARALVKFFHNRPDNAFQACTYPIGYFHMVCIDDTIFTMKCQYLPIMLIFFASSMEHHIIFFLAKNCCTCGKYNWWTYVFKK